MYTSIIYALCRRKYLKIKFLTKFKRKLNLYYTPIIIIAFKNENYREFIYYILNAVS